MLIWIRENKSRVAKWFVWPLVFVFVALYGTSSVSNQMAANQRTALKVNGERLSISEFQGIDSEVRRLYTNSLVEPEKPQMVISMEQAVARKVSNQLARELGLRADAMEVNQLVRSRFTLPAGGFDERYYARFLAETGYGTHEAYSADIAYRLENELAQARVRGAAVPAGEDVDRAHKAEKEIRVADILTFSSEDYFDEIDVATDEVEAYFNQHRARYLLPKRMKLDYVEMKPEDFIDDATPDEELMERWFRSERQQFVVPTERDARSLVFSAVAFRDVISVTDSDLQTYYDSHTADYEEPEKFKVRFLKMSVEVPDASVEAEMAKDPDNFLSEEDAVAARHILIKTPAGATPDQIDEFESQIREIRDRIQTEEDFIREAKAHSEDVSNAANGGDLGYFGRGRMVPEFDAASSALPVGTMSEPVKTSFGFHLIWVYDKREAGDTISVKEARFKVVRQIDQTPLKDAARAELTRVEEALAGGSLAAASALTDLPILETDFFSRGDIPHDEIQNDRFYFYQAISSLAAGQLAPLIEGFSGFYLAEVVEKRERQQLTLDVVKDKVENDYRTEKAGTLAREKANEAAAQIRAGSLTFELVSKTYGLSDPINHVGLRAPGGAPSPSSANVDREIVNRTFSVDVGGVDGPFDTLQGPTLLKVVRENPEHLPEMHEVRDEVEAARRKVLAERLAEEAAWDVQGGLDDGMDLAAAADAVGYDFQTTDYFRPGENVPGFPSNSVVTYVASGLRVEGATSEVLKDPPPDPNVAPNTPPQPTRAYYVIQVAALEESHLPEFDDVADVVWNDVKLEKASLLAKADADKAMAEIAQKIEEATAPFSASKSLDLQPLAEENEFKLVRTVNVRYSPNLAALPGRNTAAVLSETLYNMPLGAISNVLPATEIVPEGDKVAERVHGYAIAQLTEIQTPPTGGASRGELFRTLAGRIQDAVQTDWSERARFQAEIVPNEDYFPESTLKIFEEKSLNKG